MEQEAEIPLSVKNMIPRGEKLVSPEALEVALQFKPASADILLTSGMKSGTTWVEQILHGLRSRGDVNFEEISQAIPALENAFDSGIPDLNVEQAFSPRMFQTHLTNKDSPKGFGKTVVVVRNPVDSAVSLYHYVLNWVFQEGELSLDDFVEWFLARKHTVHFAFTRPTPLVSWYPHYKDEDVLWLHYEDLKADLTGCVKMISDFIGVGMGDQELLSLVEHQAGFQFMKDNIGKFDSHPYKSSRNKAMGWPLDAGIKNNEGRVRSGKVNDGHTKLSARVVKLMDEKWKSDAEPVTGYKSYHEMRNGINRDLGRSFG